MATLVQILYDIFKINKMDRNFTKYSITVFSCYMFLEIFVKHCGSENPAKRYS